MKNNPSQRKWFHKQKCHLINFQRKTQVQIISRTKIPLIQEVQQVAFDVDQTAHLHANSLYSTHISKHGFNPQHSYFYPRTTKISLILKVGRTNKNHNFYIMAYKIKY